MARAENVSTLLSAKDPDFLGSKTCLPLKEAISLEASMATTERSWWTGFFRVRFQKAASSKKGTGGLEGP